MSDPPPIKFSGVSKRYRGNLLALDSVDLQVERGSVFGFIGPNGAGKTTAIRLMLDLIRPSAGRIELLGEEPRSAGAALRSRIGYLPGELRLDERLTPRQTLTFLCQLHGGDLGDVWTLAERFGLDLDRKIGELSRGNKQKVGIVQAFAHDPELVILDEPTSGLDPILQRDFHELLRERARAGLTVFLSSHVLSELQEVATNVAMIREGRLLAVRDTEEMGREAPHRAMIRFEGDVPAGLFDELSGASQVQIDGKVARLLFRGEMDALIKAVAREKVIEFHSTEPSLEETFLQMYGAGDR